MVKPILEKPIVTEVRRDVPTHHFGLHPDVVAEGTGIDPIHGVRQWQTLRVRENGITREVTIASHDGWKSWEESSDGLTELHRQCIAAAEQERERAGKRDAAIAPQPVAQSAIFTPPVSKLHWLWIAGALGSGGLIMAAVDAAIRIWGG